MGGLQNAYGGGSLFNEITAAGPYNSVQNAIAGVLLGDKARLATHAFQELTQNFGANEDGTKHWKLGSPTLNPNHSSVSQTPYLGAGNKFKFVGGPEIFTVISAPEITYHVNYTGWQESSNLYTIAHPPALFPWDWHAFFDEMHRFGHPRNRRVTYKIHIDKDPTSASVVTANAGFNPIANGEADATNLGRMRFITQSWGGKPGDLVAEDPAIWETEPKKDVDLDIYYEVDGTFPLEVNNETNYSFAPIGSTISIAKNGNPIPSFLTAGPISVASWEDNKVTLSNTFQLGDYFYSNPSGIIITFHKLDGSCVSAKLSGWDEDQLSTEVGYPTWPSGSFAPISFFIEPDVSKLPVSLAWYNCYSFGNGVESQRVRDDFNQLKIDKGAKASSTLDKPYEEEHRKYGLIYSGLYNSTSGVNSLNQFIAADKITKDLNPTYGSIQKLFSRNSDVVALCEDKVLKIIANKDALFNADGNPQLIATDRVLGQAVPFAGEYGISKNPESFASESYRAYFTDKSRGAVIRLSMDGITPISEAGMSDWFKDNLKLNDRIIGSYDDKKNEYNITVGRTIKTVGEYDPGPKYETKSSNPII